MTDTMRAYRLTTWEQGPSVAEVPVPRPGPGQVVVRVAGCGLCHSDIGMASMPEQAGLAVGWRMPFTLGHESAGHVAAVGSGVTRVREGDAVALVSPTSCGRCWYCLRGMDNACPNGSAGRGYGRDGGLADYVLVEDVRGLVPLAGLDPRTAGPLTDAGATSYHAVRRALPRILPGGTVAVIGAGGLGSFAVQYLRALTGARVVAVDANPARLEIAADLGAHATLAGVDEDTTTRIRALSDGRGADAVLDFVGVDATIGAGIAAVRPGGAFGVIGAAGGTLHAPWYGGLPKDGEVFNFQGSNIADLEDAIALVEAGLVRNEVDEFPFERIVQAYEALEHGTLRGRAVVTFA